MTTAQINFNELVLMQVCYGHEAERMQYWYLYELFIHDIADRVFPRNKLRKIWVQFDPVRGPRTPFNERVL